MCRIFNYNKGIFNAINKFTDCLLASVLWLVFSIPIITFGVSTTALYHTVHKAIRDERGTVLKEFWNSFKLNLKQSTGVWIGTLVIYIIAALCCHFLFAGLGNASWAGVLIGFCILTAFVVIWSIYIFAYIARFEKPTKEIIKNCVLISIANLPWSILLYVVLAVSIVICVIYPIAAFVVPAYCVMIHDIILKKIFRKYMSEEDLEQDLEWEEKGERL